MRRKNLYRVATRSFLTRRDLESNSEVSPEPEPPDRTQFTIGAMSLVFLLIAAVVFVVTLAGAGTGVDAGLGPAFVFIRFCFPLVIVAGIMSVIAVIRNKGRVPGAITLTATGAVVLVSIWGFVSTQVF